ncbi:MAG: hypothetical protein MK066_07825, partial [Crocinitomicaceae bacterium]|nr:hypothetical protein [Crocinitomicaceae bacterium]
DSIYSNGPMSQWSSSGHVEVSYMNETLIISDYIGGQDPILILNDLKQTQDLQQFNIQLTKNFPKNNHEYYIKYLDDLVVIAYNEETCDQFIADYKLGQTIALNDKKRATIFGKLPKIVSERNYTKDSHYSKAVYKGYLLETQLGNEAPEDVATQSESFAMPCNFDIKDFTALEGLGNTVVLGVNGELLFFNNGKEKWKKNLNEKTVGNIQIIDLHGKGENHVILNTEDEIHAWDENGVAISGFPIKLEHPAVNEVKFYRWKNKSYFLIATENNRIIQYDAQGRELKIFTPEVLPKQRINVWSSQSKLFAGFLDGNSFEMYNLSKNKSHRSFMLNAPGKPAKIRNQLLHFTMNNNTLSMFDQKGIRSDFQTYPSGVIYDIHNNSNNPTVIVRSRNEIHFINQQGIPFGKVRLPFNEIDYVSYNTLNSGKTIIGVIDGLENSVYLYGIDGSRINPKPFEGKSKVIVQSEGLGLTITTVVDQFLIQYLEI